ncbi:hypothetical protein OA90_27060 [Labrenzia sp. OB1]|nr:hypothetical protein OA90_27060 [Labrenzia sp. OB1]
MMRIHLRLACNSDRNTVLKIVEHVDVAPTLVLSSNSSGWQYVETGLRNSSQQLYVASMPSFAKIVGGGRLEPGGFSYFVDPEWRQKGLGLEIARKLLAIYSCRVPGETIRLAIRRGNLPSIKIAEALGFQFSGSDTLMPHALMFELDLECTRTAFHDV